MLLSVALPNELSPNSSASILTCEPGKDLYSAFGHSAIRIKDSSLNLDLTFNYGTFDFNDPDFYQKFVRGKLKYFLSISNFNDFKQEYEEEGRNIMEQELNLRKNDIDTLYSYLLANYQPANRYYAYDFFYDNCSTRIRDILEMALRGKISLLKNTDTSRSTFRQLMNGYLQDFKWAALGMNIGLGLPPGKVADYNEQMFLPYKLYNAIGNARIYNNESLVLRTNIYNFQHNRTDEHPQSLINPLFTFLLTLIIIVAITVFEVRKKRHFFLIDNIVFITSGFLGFVLLFLWFGTSHTATVNNLNLLWLSPINFLVPFFKTRLKLYLQVYSVILLLLLVCFYWLPQEFLPEYIPLMIILLIRSVKLIYLKRGKEKVHEYHLRQNL